MRNMNFKLSFVVLIISYAASPSMGQVVSSIDSASVPVPKDDFMNTDTNQKIDQSKSLTARPGQSVSLTHRLDQLEAKFWGRIAEIKTQTSRSSKAQDYKIAKIMSRDDKLAHLLNQTKEEMVGLKRQNKDQSKRIDQLEQKLAMLQNTPQTSPALTRGNIKDKMMNGASNHNDGQLSKAFSPPSSCEELAMLDYHLDGLYLVKNKQTKKIQTVFCKFSADEKVLEVLIGQVVVETKTIHFYVQRNFSFSKPNAVMPFDVALLNEGGAFSLSSGIFQVPFNGIYHFDFSALKPSTFSGAWIDLQVNGVNVGRAGTHQGASGTFDVVSMSASLRLAAGDRVNLFNSYTGSLFEDNTGRYTHFTGWLVEEELM